MASREPAPPRDERPARAQPPARRPGRFAWYCCAAGALLLALRFGWKGVTNKTPRPIRPPVGQVLPGKTPFRFAVLGDNRSHMTILESALDAVPADGTRFLLHTGDIVRRATERDFDWVLHELAEKGVRVPLCVVPGNHDVDKRAPGHGGRYASYRAAFGPRRYWFACANALFIAFDNSSGRAEPDDLRWLNATLGRLRNRYAACFVFMHMPPRDPRPGRKHAMNGGVQALMETLVRHRVTAVFAGHIHSRLRDTFRGIPIFITGGAGAIRYEPITPYHYLLCTVRADGSLHVEQRNVEPRWSTDKVDRLFQVRFPDRLALWVGLALLAVGMAAGIRG